ncbi:hypothetical protein [Streptococcus halichoeri]|uniref:hypothetical protein n=1 Tax=Streptococcus halichoeri TaxID=254785 RepID=UPI00135BEAF3|nr:hypothetical protein [Streptococcus halichoeri]
MLLRLSKTYASLLRYVGMGRQLYYDHIYLNNDYLDGIERILELARHIKLNEEVKLFNLSERRQAA